MPPTGRRFRLIEEGAILPSQSFNAMLGPVRRPYSETLLANLGVRKSSLMADNTSKRLRAALPRENPRSERVKRLRALLGFQERLLPQDMFAVLCGVGGRTATRWEAGHQISSDDAVMMAQSLKPYLDGFTLDWLYLGEGAEPTRTARPLPDLRTKKERERKFIEAIKHSPTAWVEFDDLLRDVGIPRIPNYPLPYETARRVLQDAEIELQRMPEGELRDRVAGDIAAWKFMYGCS